MAIRPERPTGAPPASHHADQFTIGRRPKNRANSGRIHGELTREGLAAEQTKTLVRRLSVMFGIVLLLLIVVPIVELYVLFQVADGLGWATSIILLLLVSMIGGSLMKWQAAGAMGRIRKTLGEGKIPSKELADAGLMIFGGALLLTPGFFTDAFGLAMFIPPLRAGFRAMLLKRYGSKVQLSGAPGGFAFTTFGDRSGPARRAGRSFIDVDEVHVDRIPTTELPSDE